MNRPSLSAPTPLATSHNFDEFSCGEPVLDTWLREQARKNEDRSASRTYVVCDGMAVVGYYCVAAGGIARNHAPRRMQRNMPDPIPVMVLGRLATHQRYQGRGIGKAMLFDAILRVLQAADIVGVRAILVNAISSSAQQFYLRYGFLESPVEPLTLCLPLETARQSVAMPST